MDKDEGKPKTYLSTFHFVLKPREAKQVPDQRVEAPNFKEKVRNCAVGDGGSVTFQAVIAGQPLRVSWLHNGEKVTSPEPSFKDGVASLAIARCTHQNAGVYTCVAENSAGRRTSSAVLRFTGATKEVSRTNNHDLQKELQQEQTLKSKFPLKRDLLWSLLTHLDKVEVRVGERAQLSCKFRSSSQPVACCWIFNRVKEVTGGPRISVRSTEKQSCVEITQTVQEDTGLYTLVDRPSPPASQPFVSRKTTHSLVLSWSGPGYDGGTAVLGYIVEIRREDSVQPWAEISRCKNTSHHIRSGLEPQGRYRFRVRAYNSAGVSEPGKESECVKMANSTDRRQEPLSYVTVTIDTQHDFKDHYDMHEKLGVGKFGEVFRVTHKETGQVCAGKFYRARTSKDKLAARKEIRIMNKLHHSKLVQCLAAYESRSGIVMVMEYIGGGELFERIVDDNFEHTELTSARYMRQILEGMHYVHKQKIIHLDLKPENIVCVDTTGTQIKIIDFGLANELEDDKPLMVLHGTPEFVAPEVISYEPVGVETDMWSIGVICYILLSGESPFQGNSDAETLALVTAARYEARLSCAEALSHIWMASFTTLSRRATKSLNKEKIKHFLAKRKWKKTGQAVLALKRMAHFSNKLDSDGSASDEPTWSQEAEEAIQALDKQLQIEPRFLQTLRDTTAASGATATLTCHVEGYPKPEVRWFQSEAAVRESSRVTPQHQEDGLCRLLLADLKLSDSGVYTCKAVNKLGEANLLCQTDCKSMKECDKMDFISLYHISIWAHFSLGTQMFLKKGSRPHITTRFFLYLFQKCKLKIDFHKALSD
ncbi:Myosin light chain kinase, smooth muscle [Oryzias melastigma]|uniref:Myosin light chain kinase, smooth muscle n=1 Tax=Oryzias melastigma TaxID=30732 RepID=A0A834FIH9_ORYME|nr:Myosin light chain kinase, smooth muscle [Oryzias melastigma]